MNCPECSALQDVKGRPEWLFRLLVSAGFVGVLLVSFILYKLLGPAAGGISLCLGLCVLGAVAIAS
ncbi:MAG: hypothetical protein AAF581_13120 [Planctomycetota bacterium]